MKKTRTTSSRIMTCLTAHTLGFGTVLDLWTKKVNMTKVGQIYVSTGVGDHFESPQDAE